jgi:hypothetical protein
MKATDTRYTSEEIETRMLNVSFIRDCCRRLLKIDPQLWDSERNLAVLMKQFRFLFVTSWTCELDRVACCNTFGHTAAYLDKHCEVMFGAEDGDPTMYNEVMRAVATDIVANVYDVWIRRLCGNVRPKCTTLTMAKPRVIQIPQTPWVTAYYADGMIDCLETLYGKYLPLTQDSRSEPTMTLVRLNGERLPITGVSETYK